MVFSFSSTKKNGIILILQSWITELKIIMLSKKGTRHLNIYLIISVIFSLGKIDMKLDC